MKNIRSLPSRVPNVRRPALLLLAAALLALTPSVGSAQKLPDYVMRSIDSALHAILMTRADLQMRWDAVADDPHRLQVVKRLFETPLGTFDVADSLASVGLRSFDDPALMFRYGGALLDLGDNLIDPTQPTMTDVEIRHYAKVDMNSLDFTSALILRRFLSLALATDARIINNRGQISSEAIRRLIEYCDTLVLESSENADATLLELKEAERWGLARSKKFFIEDAATIDHARLLAPGVSMYSVALDYARTMSGNFPEQIDSIKTRVWSTPFGKVAIGGTGDDVYTGDFFCIVDVGGNDIYKANSLTKQKAFERGVSLLVDFDGDDTYIGGDFSFGGTLFGAATLIDMKGDDNYSTGNFGLGCGYFGIGVLYDHEGSDRYAGGTCVQGAGLFGIGLLYDNEGNDNYLAHFEAQGFGFTRGLGGLIDNNGNDSYIAASPYKDYLRYDDHYATFCQGAALGSRPVASAGIGFLAEGGGNDTYVSDIYGQGTAYWYGIGALVDRKGGDSYNSYQYSQGAGVHLAHGVLIDDAGNDNYTSHGVSQGCGHDIAFGGLYDAAGDDNYVVESLSLGGGNADAISLFVDAGGEDGYIARRTNTLGFSDYRRMYGMVGLFLDLEGKDFYGTARGGNDSLWTGFTYGAGLDANVRPKTPSGDPAVTGSQELTKTPEEIASELGPDIPTLFIQASAAPQKYQYLVGPAQTRLVERADESIPYLLSQLNTESARERLALGFVLPRMGAKVIRQLIDTVLFGHPSRVGMAMYVLGEMHDSTAAAALGQKLVDSVDWRTRASAGEALIKMNAASAKEYLKRALRDTIDLIRGRAARALAVVADSAELELLLPMLNDRSQIVRYQTQLGLQQRSVDSIAPFFTEAIVGRANGVARRLLYSLAFNLKNPDARERILDVMLNDSVPAVRAEGVRLALAWGDKTSLRRAAKIKPREKNSMVLYEIYRVLELEKEQRKSKRKKKETG